MLASLRSFWDRRQAMREMKALQQEEDEELDYSDTNPLHLAKASLAIGDLGGARQYWNLAWNLHQSYVKQSPDTLPILLRLKLFDEAEAIILEGLKRFPGEARYAEGYALVAEHRGDLTEAVVRWQQTRKKFPNAWTAYVNPSRCLRELALPDEAEGLARQAVAKFPNLINGWLEYARIAEAKEDWELAKQRWLQVNERFMHVVGILGQVRAMLKLGQVEDAEKFLIEMRPNVPGEPEAAMQLALIAEIRGNTEVALERWAFVRQRFPQFFGGYRESARFLKSIGMVNEMESLLVSARERFPSEAHQIAGMA